ncbi:hypothetical protein, partial [Arsenophonus nasoniae]|uniref:hypothetical protein n=1 Tax=Arsenophonus nasoniae TaxID=638 RepID=UPI003879844E
SVSTVFIALISAINSLVNLLFYVAGLGAGFFMSFSQKISQMVLKIGALRPIAIISQVGWRSIKIAIKEQLWLWSLIPICLR